MEPPDRGAYPCALMIAPSLARGRLAGFLTATLLAACGAAPEPAGHVHRVTTTVTVTDDGLLPAATVTIPVFSTVVWRNRGTHPLAVKVEATACPSCDTVFGFVTGEDGARSVSLEPGAVATLCFHGQGSFPFVARVGDHEHRGVIEVGGMP